MAPTTTLFQRPDFRVLALHAAREDLVAITTHGAFSRGRWLRLGMGINRVAGSVLCKDGIITCQMTHGEILCIDSKLRVVARASGAPPGKYPFPPSTNPDGRFAVLSQGQEGVAVYQVDGLRKIRLLSGVEFALLNRPGSKPAITVSKGMVQVAANQCEWDVVSVSGGIETEGAIVRGNTSLTHVAFDGTVTDIALKPGERLLSNGWILNGTVVRHCLHGTKYDLGTAALEATQVAINENKNFSEAILCDVNNKLLHVSIPESICNVLLTTRGLEEVHNTLQVPVLAAVSNCPRPSRFLGCKYLLLFVNKGNTSAFEASTPSILSKVDLGLESEETIAVGDCDNHLMVVTRNDIRKYQWGTFRLVDSIGVEDVIDACVSDICVIARQGEVITYNHALSILNRRSCPVDTVRITDSNSPISASSTCSIACYDSANLSNVTSISSNMWVTDHCDQGNIMAVCYGFGACDIYSNDTKSGRYEHEPIRLLLGSRPLRIIGARGGKFIVAGESIWIVDSMGASMIESEHEILDAALVNENYIYTVEHDGYLRVRRIEI